MSDDINQQHAAGACLKCVFRTTHSYLAGIFLSTVHERNERSNRTYSYIYPTPITQLPTKNKVDYVAGAVECGAATVLTETVVARLTAITTAVRH